MTNEAEQRTPSELEARADRSPLAAFLSDRDVACPNCAYNLRGIRDAVCPECRQPLVLSVELEDSKSGLLVSAVVGLMCGFAPAAALGGLVLVMSIREGELPPRRGEELWFLYIWPIVTTIGLGIPLRRITSAAGRMRFRSRSRPVAKRMMTWCWICGLGAMMVFAVSLVMLSR